jgi:hypothetical protein
MGVLLGAAMPMKCEKPGFGGARGCLLERVICGKEWFVKAIFYKGEEGLSLFW